jgi:hypothetical protein
VVVVVVMKNKKKVVDGGGGDDDDNDGENLFQKITDDEVDFPEDLSLAAISFVSKVNVITSKSETVICDSLLYALECNLPYLVLNLQ